MTTRSSIRFGVHFRLRHAAAVAALAAAGIALGPARGPVRAHAAAAAPASGAAAGQPAQDPNAVINPVMFQGLRFRSVGPHRGGRVTAVAGVRQQPCTFYMGATGGGVWKTTDCGSSWLPISDGQIDTGSIGAIAVSESNPDIVWVGTGSAAIRSNVIIGRGVYKSTDAGRTWQYAGLKDAGQIGSIAIHPTNPDIVWLAAMGSPYGPTDRRGVFRTTNGGREWARVLTVNRETGARVVAVNPANPNEVFAGMYRGFRKGWDIVSGGPADEGGIYKSTDGGETWGHLRVGLPMKLIGKIDIDIARSKPSTIYAMVEAPGQEGGLYKSTDSGDTWALVNNSQRLRARPFYFHYVDVNPNDEHEVWVSEVGLWKSTDGGRTFSQVPTPHVDNHGLWFNPDLPGYAVACNDGGATVTRDGGATWSSILNQPTGEFYMVSVDEQFPYRLYGPQQDNTTVVVPSLPPVAWGLDSPVQAWGQVAGCETGQVWPRPDGSVVWGACKGQVGRYVTATGQEQQYWVYPQNRYGHNPKDIKYRFPRQTVVYLSPHDPKTIYQASHVVHRSVDEGVTWETISHDLTAYEPDKQITPGTPITRDITGEEVYSSLYAFVESRLEPGVLWAGSNDGPVHVSRDAGKSWRRVTPPDLPPGGRVQTIEDSPHRKGSAYIAVYRYLREHDLEPYIYATADYGATWTRLTDGRNGIPGDHPTRVVREDPSREGLLYAGTEFGLFVSFDNGRHWQPLQQNLPHTPVTDIRVHRQDLVLSTMGRGFWILDDVTLLQQLAARHELVMHSEGYLFQPRDAWRMRYRPTGGSAGQPEYPPPGAIIDYYLAGEPAGEVKLEIMDGKRGVIRTLSVGGGAGGAAGAPGQAAGQQTGPAAPPRRGRAGAALPRRAWHNRFVWDLRLEGSGGSPGPLAVPGSYLLRLSVGEWSQTRTIEVRIDPRVAAAGVTQADLQEQLDLALAIRDAMSGASALASKIAAAGQAATANAASARALQSLHGRLVTAGGAYPQPMLIDQLANVALMISQADQKVGRDAFARFEDLSKELAAVEAEAARLGIR